MKKDYDVVLRGHHINTLRFYLAHGAEKLKTIFRDGKRSSGYTKNAINILKKITNSDVRVKFISTLDDICKSCNARDKTCTTRLTASCDKEWLEYYGFKVSKIYSSKHILKKLQKVERENKI